MAGERVCVLHSFLLLVRRRLYVVLVFLIILLFIMAFVHFIIAKFSWRQPQTRNRRTSRKQKNFFFAFFLQCNCEDTQQKHEPSEQTTDQTTTRATWHAAARTWVCARNCTAWMCTGVSIPIYTPHGQHNAISHSFSFVEFVQFGRHSWRCNYIIISQSKYAWPFIAIVYLTQPWKSENVQQFSKNAAHIRWMRQRNLFAQWAPPKVGHRLRLIQMWWIFIALADYYPKMFESQLVVISFHI